MAKNERELRYDTPVNFCPKCGSQLRELKGRYFAYHTCEENHLWQIYQDSTRSEWHFQEREWATCAECLEKFPKPELTENLCGTCLQKEKDSWQMDGEKSHAILTITPMVSPEGKHYYCDATIEIRPYPNPLSYGGMYSMQTAKNEEELEQVIANFNNQAEKLKKQGMKKVEIVRQEERMITKQTLLLAEQMETKPKAAEKQLSLL